MLMGENRQEDRWPLAGVAVMTIPNEPCRGTWVSSRNICPCPHCQRVNAARSDFISANEQVSRLHNQGADVLAIAKAEQARERMGERWREAAVNG